MALSLVEFGCSCGFFFFFFNDTATTEIYTLSLHDALPIYPIKKDSHIVILRGNLAPEGAVAKISGKEGMRFTGKAIDRKSTRLNSSHSQISYAVFCLKKKKQTLTSTVPLSTSSRPLTSSAT